MSSTKFKVKQVKNDSETRLETFVVLPIDQQDATRLMPSEQNIDIGSGALNWGDAYLSNTSVAGDLDVTGDLTLGDANKTHTILGNVDISGANHSVSGVTTFNGSTRSTEIRSKENLELPIKSDMGVTVILDSDKEGIFDDGSEFKVKKGPEGSSTDLLTLDQSGNLDIVGNLSAVDISLTGEVKTDLSLDGKIEASGTSPLVIDASSVIVENSKTSGTSSITLRDNINAKSSISLIEGTGVFAGSANYGFKLEYNGEDTPNSLSLTSGYGTYTADVFTVKRDNGVNSPNSDIVFKGVVECDPDSAGEGGLRSAYLGGTTASPNSLSLTTESSDGHFNSTSADDGTFTVYGPRNTDGGKLQIVGNEIALYNGDTIFSGSGLELTKEEISGSTKLVPILKNLHFASFSGYYNLIIKPDAPNVQNSLPQYSIAGDTSGFTGCHRYIGNDESLELGDSVLLDNDLKCSRTLEANSTKCVGVVVALVQCGPYEEGYDGFKHVDSLGRIPGDSGSAETMVVVASVGDSFKDNLQGFKVCNEGGDIAAGDLLVTSSVPGRLMKQTDDVIRASTVGKAMQPVTFNDQGQADDVYGFLYCG